MEDRFYKAIFAPEARICGRWRRRFTLWHSLILETLESPFVQASGEIRAEDVLRLLRVVECDYPNQPNFRWRLRDVIWRRRMARNLDTLKREAGTIRDWLAEVNSPPEFWIDSSKKGGGITGPPVWALAWRLVTGCRYSLADALNETMGRAWWSVAQVDELSGYGRKFAWEADLDRIRALPDLTKATEEEIEAQARKDLSPALAERFLQRRKANQC